MLVYFLVNHAILSMEKFVLFVPNNYLIHISCNQVAQSVKLHALIIIIQIFIEELVILVNYLVINVLMIQVYVLHA